MTRTVSQKMRIREGMTAYLLNVPEDALEALDLPRIRRGSALVGSFEYIHCFVTEQSELDTVLPKLKKHLDLAGTLWVSWPKGRRLGTDLALPEVIRISYTHGLVESTCLSVNDTWSALKLTLPKRGRVYNNRYGTLPSSAPRR
jgi:hypothetical protein